MEDNFKELYLKECKSNEQNLMAYLGEKERVERLEKEIEHLKFVIRKYDKYANFSYAKKYGIEFEPGMGDFDWDNDDAS